MAKGVFITGTDTGIGKTYVTLSLMEAFKEQGYKVAGMKPIASGAARKHEQLKNEDAESILQCCSESTAYELINPAVYELPVSPHIAARQTGHEINLSEIENSYKQLASKNEVVIVEGVGGWRVPISEEQNMVDLVRLLGLPVIMVVGLKLGCLNHAILTAETIKTDGLNMVGWISNRVEEDYIFPEESLKTLKNTLESPCLGDLPFDNGSVVKNQSQSLNMSLISNSL